MSPGAACHTGGAPCSVEVPPDRRGRVPGPREEARGAGLRHGGPRPCALLRVAGTALCSKFTLCVVGGSQLVPLIKV